MLDDDRGLAKPLGTRRRDVVEPDDVEHCRAHEARHRRRLEQAEHRHRHDRLTDHLQDPADARCIDVGGVDEGQPVQRDREDQDEQDAGEEGRQREANEGERVGDLVEYRIGLGRGIDADGNRDQQRQDLGRPDHVERGRKALEDELIDVHPADERKTPVAVHHGRQPVQVTKIDRIIQAKLGPKCGLHFGRDVRIGRKFGERVAGSQRQHEEQHCRDAEQARNRDQQAAQDILTHQGEILSAAVSHASRYQSWMLSVSFAQPLSAGRNVLAAASTFRRCITGMNTVSCQSRSLHLM